MSTTPTPTRTPPPPRPPLSTPLHVPPSPLQQHHSAHPSHPYVSTVSHPHALSPFLLDELCRSFPLLSLPKHTFSHLPSPLPSLLFPACMCPATHLPPYPGPSSRVQVLPLTLPLAQAPVPMYRFCHSPTPLPCPMFMCTGSATHPPPSLTPVHMHRFCHSPSSLPWLLFTCTGSATHPPPSLAPVHVYRICHSPAPSLALVHVYRFCHSPTPFPGRCSLVQVLPFTRPLASVHVYRFCHSPTSSPCPMFMYTGSATHPPPCTGPCSFYRFRPPTAPFPRSLFLFIVSATPPNIS